MNGHFRDTGNIWTKGPERRQANETTKTQKTERGAFHSVDLVIV